LYLSEGRLQARQLAAAESDALYERDRRAGGAGGAADAAAAWQLARVLRAAQQPAAARRWLQRAWHADPASHRLYAAELLAIK